MFSHADRRINISWFRIVLTGCASILLSALLAGCEPNLGLGVEAPVPTTVSVEPTKTLEDFTMPAMPGTPTVVVQGTPIPILGTPGQVTPFTLLPPYPENPLTPPPGPECRGRVAYTTTQDFISIPAVAVTQTVTPTMTPAATVTPGK